MRHYLIDKFGPKKLLSLFYLIEIRETVKEVIFNTALAKGLFVVEKGVHLSVNFVLKALVLENRKLTDDTLSRALGKTDLCQTKCSKKSW